MLLRIITITVVLGAAYWYWSGPYQEKINPSYQTVVEQNDTDMRECQRGAAYKLGATGKGAAPELAQQQCAKRYNVYEKDGHWHRYDMSRPN